MSEIRIAVIGLGYVGLPLAVEFGRKYQTIGFDINENRIRELKEGRDHTLEVENGYLKEVIQGSNIEHGISFSSKIDDIKVCNHFIVAVPTPTDKNNRPILVPLCRASETVGKILKKGDVVVFESTVYPGVTEEECVPILEQVSGLVFNRDFFVGYSPERINPGDKEHTLTKIKKITSGSTPEVADRIDHLYNSIISAGTYKASTIKVAEAAKVIENSQRDINIAFVNELSQIFNLMNIDTREVLEAAGTKWNFLRFQPGLVGGHCIGVDPFYLAQKAQEVGYHPEIILAGRRLNDSMGKYVAGEVVKLMLKKGYAVKGARALLLGITFKENCPDIRNTKAIDIYKELIQFGLDVDVYDPWADPVEVKQEYNIDLISHINGYKYDAVILGVAHKTFRDFDPSLLRNGHQAVIYDIKGVWQKELVDGRL